MVASGLAFGIATARARVLPAWAAGCFTAGVAANVVIVPLPVPELAQVVGSALRIVGLTGMG